MATPGERTSRVEEILEQINERLGSFGEIIARVEGVLEQVSERLGRVEDLVLRILEQKADKSEVRLFFVTSTTLFVAIMGLLGAILAAILIRT